MQKRFRVALVNMPFCYLESPSLALAQLRTVLQEDPALSGGVDVDICHAQHDFAVAVGLDLYRYLADSEDALAGEWLFSNVLFPRSDAEALGYIREFCPEWSSQLMAARQRVADFIDQLIDSHHLDSADIVGMTSLYQQNVASLALAKRLRARSPDKVIVLGGGNCEGAMGKAIMRNFDFLDYVFSGCGLVSFPRFVTHIAAGQRALCDGIDGIFSKSNSCDITWDLAARASVVPAGAVTEAPANGAGGSRQVGLHGQERPVGDVVNVDYTDFLDSFERQIQALSPGVKPRLPLETSRGCWWGEKSHCTFCGSCGWDISYRQMSSAQAVDYINGLVAAHGDRTPYFECVDQLIPKDFPEDVMPHLRLGNVGLFYEVRTTLSEQHMRLLRHAGVRTIQPGVEALSTDLLKHMAKGVTGAHNIQHLKRCAELGMTPMWALLVGLPGEDDSYYDFYRKILPKLVHLPPPMTVSPIGFHRNSPYTWYPEKYGLKIRPARVYDHIFPIEPKEIADLAYFFEDGVEDPAYRRNVAKHGMELGLIVEIWRRAWVGHSGALPQLYFDESPKASTVIDTRGGVQIVHQLTETEQTVLSMFREVTPLSTLQKTTLIDSSDILPAVQNLQKKGLLFIEGGRAISLVLNGATDVPDFVELLRRGEVVLH